MFAINSRVVRRPLALSVTTLTTLAALALLSACADEPVSPTPRPPTSTASAQPNSDQTYITVTNTSGGTEVGSIRWAASQVNVPGIWTIQFDPRLAGDTITLGDELYLDFPAKIEGPPGGITLSGNDQHRVIRAEGLALENVTVTRGNSDVGSAIHVYGNLVLQHTTVQDNRGSGSVIEVDGKRVQMFNSTISRNVGTGTLDYEDGAQVLLTHSTIAFNTGPGLSYENGPSTFTKVELHNSIIANNTPENCTDNWHFQYLGTNISSDWSCGEVYIVVADPQLAPLAHNGGPNMTHAIPFTSPAFNAAGTVDCMSEDQRYVVRGEKCDVGAFEFNDFTKVAVTIDNGVKVSSTTGKAALTGTVKCTRPEAFTLLLELHQDQKINGEIVDVHSVSSLPVQCGTTAKSWSVPMNLLPGEAFQSGAAKAIAQTSSNDLPEWVAPTTVTSGVRISLSRK